MNGSLIASFAGLVLLLIVSASLLRRRASDRHADVLRRLLDLADLLEKDLKTCRGRLQQAHAVMSLNPDQPATGETEAQQAIDAGLRFLLAQRIWIRDHAQHANRRELDQAAAGLADTRDRLQPLLSALDRAQHELDVAMREHIPREPGA